MEIGREILFTEFGSFVYGTNVPTSDHDFKGIFVPSKNDILLQRAGKTSIQENSKLDPTAKNSAEDTDVERFTLQSFIRLCAEGQTVAVDLLFTPKKFWLRDSAVWTILQNCRHKLVHQGISSYIGYANQQAAKYGVKGSRLSAVKKAIEFFSGYDGQKRLRDIEGDVRLFVNVYGQTEKSHSQSDEPLVRMVTCKGPQGQEVPHLEVCGRKIPIHDSIKHAREVFTRIDEQYGHRARMAETNEGVDWKACMHAVRVAGEAKELLETGFVTFPRPEKDLLLQIRKGELPYAKVAEMIEEGVAQIHEAKTKSTLPEAIDLDFWNDFIVAIYSIEVKGEIPNDPEIPESSIRVPDASLGQ